jgi:hypothetical protein
MLIAPNAPELQKAEPLFPLPFSVPVPGMAGGGRPFQAGKAEDRKKPQEICVLRLTSG